MEIEETCKYATEISNLSDGDVDTVMLWLGGEDVGPATEVVSGLSFPRRMLLIDFIYSYHTLTVSCVATLPMVLPMSCSSIGTVAWRLLPSRTDS